MLEVGRDRNGMRRNGDGEEDSREDKDADDDEDKDANDEDQFPSMNAADQRRHH